MKHSEMLRCNGVIYNEITDIMARAELKRKNQNLLVICNDGEIFDQAIITIRNRYPKVVGIQDQNAGVKLVVRRMEVSTVNELSGSTVKILLLDRKAYEADKTAIDALSFDGKHEIMSTGGLI